MKESGSKMDAITNWMTFASEWFCGLVGLIILLISLSQIVLRVGFNVALPWVFELTALLAVYAVFIGSVALILGERTAQVRLFVDMFPGVLQKILSAIVTISASAMGILLIYGGWVYKGVLSTYTMSNLPLSSSLFSYPIILFGVSLIWKVLLSANRTRAR